MKAKELIEKLNELDPEKNIYIPSNEYRGFAECEYYEALTVKNKTLTVLDESEECIVIEFE